MEKVPDKAPGKGRVLVVEDEADLADSYDYVLKRNGYGVVVASNVLEAISKIENGVFVCVLLDMNLGGRAGGERILQFLRGSQANPNHGTPVLVISGFLNRDLVVRIGSEVDGVLVKPFRMSEVVQRVNALVRLTDAA